jgi:hypothetical protein
MPDDWVIRQNIERYRHLLTTELDEAKRRAVIRLLALATEDLTRIGAPATKH